MSRCPSKRTIGTGTFQCTLPPGHEPPSPHVDHACGLVHWQERQADGPDGRPSTWAPPARTAALEQDP